MIESKTTPSGVESLEYAEPCGSPMGCDRVATTAIWCDHHLLECSHSGFRCDVHLNLLISETERDVKRIRSGQILICVNCHVKVTGDLLSDHLRWVPL